MQYGKRPVLREVSLSIGAGEIVALVGANAAGKTTTLRTIMGLKEPAAGAIRFDGEDVTRLSTVERVRRGLALSPEGRQIFPKFSVQENLLMGGYHRADRNHLERRHRARLRDVSAAGRAAQPEGRLHVGRRTADAGDRPCA